MLPTETVLAVTSATAVPAPGGMEVAFGLSAEGTVRVRILNIAGRSVRTLCRTQELPAGLNRLVWDARADNGLPVPAGVYLVEVLAASPDGSQARALVPARWTR